MYKSKSKKRIVKSKPKYKIAKNLPNDYNYIKAELVDTIGMLGASSTFTFQNSGNQYVTLGTIILNASSFVQYQGEYTRFKVTGIHISAAQCSSPEHLRTFFLLGAPACALAFYPQNTTQGMANAPANKDNNMLIYPNVTDIQMKYYGIPDGYMDTGAAGLGTWNSTNNASQITGQLHLAPLDSSNTSSGGVNVYLLRIVVYIVLSGKID